MNKIMSDITASMQAFVTAAAMSTSTGVSASAVVELSKYANVVATVHMPKLPDAKGALGVATLSFYECLSTGLTGSVITASIVTNSKISNSVENYLVTEIRADQLSDNFKYVYAHVNAPTKSDVSVMVYRGHARYEPQS